MPGLHKPNQLINQSTNIQFRVAKLQKINGINKL